MNTRYLCTVLIAAALITQSAYSNSTDAWKEYIVTESDCAPFSSAACPNEVRSRVSFTVEPQAPGLNSSANPTLAAAALFVEVYKIHSADECPVIQLGIEPTASGPMAGISYSGQSL